MKSVVEWDEDYILNLPPGEHDWVEFKDGRLLDFSLPGVDPNKVLDELAKQISAFANSGGGAIVYGISDASVGAARAVDSNGGVSLTLKKGTKEWLEDIISGLVEFPLVRFNIYVVLPSSPASGIRLGKGIIVVDIPSSDAAPHQNARDKKYYARVAGKSLPIGHRLVVDIFGRTRHPTMVLEATLRQRGTRRGANEEASLTLRLENIGRIVAYNVYATVILPKELVQSGNSYFREVSTDRVSISMENIHEDIVAWERSVYSSYPLKVTRPDPVLPGLGFNRSEELAYDLHEVDLMEVRSRFAEEVIEWEAYADNATVERGTIRIGDIQIV